MQFYKLYCEVNIGEDEQRTTFFYVEGVGLSDSDIDERIADNLLGNDEFIESYGHSKVIGFDSLKKLPEHTVAWTI